MGYRLRALITRHAAVVGLDPALGIVGRPQDFALMPITDAVFDGLGGGEVRPFDGTFYFLSGGIRDLAVDISRTAPLAYVEADFFGRAGFQSAVAWSDQTVICGPLTHRFNATCDERSRESWPINTALITIGVARGESIDEFAALGLNEERSTEDWT